jgi:hypothetical protein
VQGQIDDVNAALANDAEVPLNTVIGGEYCPHYIGRGN